jgi:predicted glycosyltransferase
VSRRVFFYVQHLLGIGHLRRAATLTRAMSAAGLDVALVSGGHKVPGLDIGGGRLVQLAPTRATDLYFKVLVDENDQPIDDAWRAARRRQLIATWREFRPHVLMFELFPFGRRQMRFELLPLLDASLAAHRRPVIVSSVRDILVGQHKAARNDEVLGLIETYFDHVMVHGDPQLVSFEETFAHAGRIADKLVYTGYAVDRGGQSDAVGRPGHEPSRGASHNEVIVSAGGGAVGLELLRTAIAARPATRLNRHRWRVLVGIKVPNSEHEALVRAATPGIVVERARPDFTTLIRNCTLSISQGGYNTVFEVLDAGVRGVIVPYAGGIETEQTLRAARLAERGLVHVLTESALTPQALAATIEAAMDAPPTSTAGIDTGGSEKSAALIGGWADGAGW